MPTHKVVVVGASAGGLEAISALVCDLPTMLLTAIFVVIHYPPTPGGFLADILKKICPLPAKYPRHGETILMDH